MKYRANLYATPLGILLTVVLFLVLSFLILAREHIAATFLSCSFFIVVIRVYRRSMGFSDDVFKYDGWFSSFEIRYSDISKVESRGSVGYPVDRWHGPLEYRITTKDKKKIWVSLLWFGSSASREFHQRVIRRLKAKRLTKR